MIQRHIASRLLQALADSPVVLLHGARQTGKSTLIQHITSTDHPARYLTFDDAATLSAATSDPAGFLAGAEGPVALDEVQPGARAVPGHQGRRGPQPPSGPVPPNGLG